MTDPNATILVIDDEQTILESITDYLEDRNYRVLAAENGRIGLKLLTSEHPDLILTDLRMPEVDGMEVLQRAKEIAPDTPVIVVSGTGHLGDSIRALRLGAWDYIFKPIEDLSIISHAVDKALERARLLKENLAYQENLEALVRQRTLELERANAELAAINTRLRHIVETTRKLSGSSDVVQFGLTLMEEFAKHMMAEGGSLFLMEKDGLRLLYALDPHHVPEFIPFPLPEDSVFRRAISIKKPLLIHDIAKEKTSAGTSWRGYSDGSALLFPLSDQLGEIAGILALHNKKSPPFIEQDKEIGTILASYSCETLRAVRSTESLRASEERFKDLARMLPEAIFETDLNMNLVFANQKALEIFKYSKEDLDQGIPLLSIIAPKDRSRAEDNLHRLTMGEKIAAVEYEGLRKDGSTLPMLFHINTIFKNNQASGLRGVMVDITVRKQSEELIRQSERRYRMLFEKSTDAIFVVASDTGSYLDANEAALRLSGRSRPEIQRLTTAEMILEDTAGRLEKIRVSQRSIEFGKTTFLRPSGEKRIAVLNTVPLEEEIFIDIARDITDELAMEAQLIQAQKMEAVGRLAGGVAHDLNNLLSPILGYSEMLLDDSALSETQRDFLNEVLNAGLRSRDLVRQLLAFSRKQALAFNPLDINKTIAGFEKLLRRTIPEDIVIQVIPSPDIQVVMADVGQIEQVILNLAVNAADAMPNGGQLTIQTAMEEITSKENGALLDGAPVPHVILSVGDTGCGIDEAIREHIFEPFFSTKGDRGTGLGLSTVYGIVKQHGGQIRLDSQPGKGTIFKISLPAAVDIEVEERSAQSVSSNLKGIETILLVEDNDQVRAMAQTILARQGYTVLTAKDGKKALSILTSAGGSVHLLLTDVVMPQMNGKELHAKAQKLQPGLKALYMSGYTDDVIAHRGVLEQGIHFIQKPFSTQTLSAKVREVLDQK